MINYPFINGMEGVSLYIKLSYGECLRQIILMCKIQFCSKFNLCSKLDTIYSLLQYLRVYARFIFLFFLIDLFFSRNTKKARTVATFCEHDFARDEVGSSYDVVLLRRMGGPK